jgi:MFS family permease
MTTTLTANTGTTGTTGTASTAGGRWAALVLLVSAQFVVMLDTSIVNVALPSIQADLGLRPTAITWVVNAYVLSFGGLLLLAGRTADLFGRRRLFVGGSLLFAAGTLLAASASSATQLVGGRVVQGIGAAALSPAAMSLLLLTFGGQARARAMSIWGAASALGGAAGVMTGGLLVGAFGWSSVFLVTVPASVAAVALAGRVLPEGARGGTRRRFDWPGAATITGAVVALVHGALGIADHGWTSPTVIAALTGSAALAALFISIERRTADPLLPLDLFRSHTLTTGVAWLGVICYGLQIYYDFSGYSDMAIGLGRMLGIEFLENFNYPYISRSLGEFWRRWHISLSSWLRDYLFLPLAYAASRRITVERWLRIRADLWAYAVATLVTMFLCGVWHRATWGCAVWGLWHGVFLTLENTRRGKRVWRRLGSPARLLLTQWVVLMGWVFFRATSLGHGASILSVLYGFGRTGAVQGASVSVGDYLNRPLVLALCVGVPLCGPAGSVLGRWVTDRLRRRGAATAWLETAAPYAQVVLLVGLLAVSAMALAAGTYSPFVYQQF